MKADLIELIECAQHNYEVLLDERDHFQDIWIKNWKKQKKN